MAPSVRSNSSGTFSYLNLFISSSTTKMIFFSFKTLQGHEHVVECLSFGKKGTDAVTLVSTAASSSSSAYHPTLAPTPSDAAARPALAICTGIGRGPLPTPLLPPLGQAPAAAALARAAVPAGEAAACHPSPARCPAVAPALNCLPQLQGPRAGGSASVLSDRQGGNTAPPA